MSDGLLTPEAQKALVRLEMDQPFHDAKLRRIKKQQMAYEGLLEPNSEAAEWESKLAPPILNHVIETALSMLVEDDTSFEVMPMPKFYKPDEWQAALDGARAHERLFRRQMLADHFAEFQRPFILQAAINRVSIAKTHWREEIVKTKELQYKPTHAFLGRLSPQTLKEVEVTKPLFDGPKTEVVDLRDFYWQESAVSLEKSRYCAHAVWMTPGDIMKLAQSGEYDKTAAEAIYSLETGDSSLPMPNDIELEREKRSRKKGLVEVLEVWDRETSDVYVIGRRRFLLKVRSWPFWHRQYPFTEMSLAPFPFSIQGLSLVEKLADMQEAYWSLLNQTRDNTKLLNNAIILMAADFDDPDAFDYAPGAVNVVDRPDQINLWTPSVQIAEMAMPLMQQIQGDMQNLAMGQPISIPVSGRVTATEIATLSQIAQSAASKMKAQVTYAYQRIGYQRMKLNQQFIRTPQYIHDLGLDSEPKVEEIMPQLLAGDFDFILTPSTESNIRAERRAESTQLMTLATQAAPALAQMGTPLNGRKFMERVLEAYGVDPEGMDEYFSAQPQSLQGQASQQNPENGQEGVGPGGVPAGVTGAGATNATTSPSNAASLAPGVMMARAFASQGGVRNALQGR